MKAEDLERRVFRFHPGMNPRNRLAAGKKIYPLWLHLGFSYFLAFFGMRKTPDWMDLQMKLRALVSPFGSIWLMRKWHEHKPGPFFLVTHSWPIEPRAWGFPGFPGWWFSCIFSAVGNGWQWPSLLQQILHLPQLHAAVAIQIYEILRSCETLWIDQFMIHSDIFFVTLQMTFRCLKIAFCSWLGGAGTDVSGCFNR